jgi:thiamine-monophosphate kinase
VGGDTTRGPLAISITIFGEVPTGQALLRSGARPGDEVWVSGTLGDARLALEVFRGTRQVPQAVFEAARERMECPTPRVSLGLALRGVASAAIDVSDGLVGDLGHVLAASGVGATLRAEQVAALPAQAQALSVQDRMDFALAGGDDYELAFTAPAAARDAVLAAGRASGTAVHCIGVIEAAPGLRLVDAAGQAVLRPVAAFDHFA